MQECAQAWWRCAAPARSWPLPRRNSPAAPDTATLQSVTRALGLTAGQVRAAQVLDNGPVWLGLLLDSADTVLGLQPDHAAPGIWASKWG